MFHAHHIARLSKIAQGVPIVLTGYKAMQLSGDMTAPFLQESTFWWLSGIEEPGWRMIIEPMRGVTTLIAPERSDVDRIFNGEPNYQALLDMCGAHEVLQSNEFEPRLRQLARTHAAVYTLAVDEEDFVLNPAKRELIHTLERIFPSVSMINKEVNELRAIKSEEEIRRISAAIKETMAAFRLVREHLEDYRYEYEVEAAFTQHFRGAGHTHAYAPIVACGQHACTLHYEHNSGKVSKRELTVIDIGARVHGYAADITRTYAVQPTKRQRAVHAAVQSAHERIIELIRPNLLVSEYADSVDEVMKDALQELGLLSDRRDQTTYRKYFPHAVSHGLGVDVHDSLGVPRYLKPGMVLTVEPGIYIPEEGIGVRIEDDIHVTETGHVNLSRALSTEL